MHQKIETKLKDSHLNYTIHQHAQLAVPIRNPQDFANALGYGLERITKTLFIKGDVPGKYAMAVCSINKQVNFALLASAMKCKRVQVARREELQEMVGYPPNGVSPLGIDEFPVFLDEDLLSFKTVLIGAGETGVEIEIAPANLKFLTNAIVLKLSI
jgi:Cys-tRNA(Pro)/Cys-tRNA(Cys) deacylase